MDEVIYKEQIENLSDYQRVASDILQSAGDTKVFVLQGDLGAGKTTLVKSLCLLLGVSESVSSPSFSLVNEYKSTDPLLHPPNLSIYHLDLYRLASEQEALNIGIEEILQSGNFCFVEWPEIIEQIIPLPIVVIQLRHLGANSRSIQWKKVVQ